MRMRRDRRRPVVLGLALAMVLGIFIYSRLWVMDYRIASDEADLLRKQFDLASREAMDESAEWRFKYDQALEKASKCAKELNEIKGSLEKNPEDATEVNKKLRLLQKENMGLVEQVKSLKQELEAEKLKCKAR